jgi:prepilin-type N-terminal cleavage/methylation domain-containing protein
MSEYPTHSGPLRRRLGGFTLLELLIVIAIIAALIAILVPVLSGARRQGKRAVCLSNLRQIGQAMQFYGNEYDDEIPASLHFGFDFSHGTPWGHALYEGVTGQPWTPSLSRDDWVLTLNTIYHCPLDEIWTKPGEPFDQWSYGINVYIGPPVDELVMEGRDWSRLNRIPKTSTTVAFGEMAAASAMAGGGRADHIMAHYWTYYGVPPGGELDLQRHKPDSAYMFVDGHAAQSAFRQTIDLDIGLNDWNPAAAQ